MDSNNENIRILSCDIIQNAGILLRLPQVAMVTAQMLIQKLYLSSAYSPDKFYLDITAMVALFEAAKIEECRRDARHVIDVFTYVITTRLGKETSLNNSEYEKVREQLVVTERRLLKTLGYKSLLSIHPHKIIVNYYRAMADKLDPDSGVWKDHERRKLIQAAWNYCNDSLRIDVFLKYSKEAVACACIQMACEDNQMYFPKSTNGMDWYCLFVDELEAKAAMDMIRRFYQSEKINPNDFKRIMFINRLLAFKSSSSSSSSSFGRHVN